MSHKVSYCPYGMLQLDGHCQAQTGNCKCKQVPSERQLVQLTLSPDELIWLFAAANVGHCIAWAKAAELDGNYAVKEKAITDAIEQLPAVFQASGRLGNGFDVSLFGRMETLIKATSPNLVEFEQFDDDGT